MAPRRQRAPSRRSSSPPALQLFLHLLLISAGTARAYRTVDSVSARTRCDHPPCPALPSTTMNPIHALLKLRLPPKAPQPFAAPEGGDGARGGAILVHPPGSGSSSASVAGTSAGSNLNYLKLMQQKERVRDFMAADATRLDFIGGAGSNGYAHNYSRNAPAHYGDISTSGGGTMHDGTDAGGGSADGGSVKKLMGIAAAGKSDRRLGHQVDEYGCDFERECSWTVNATRPVDDGGAVVSVRAAAGPNEPGPKWDASDNKIGHFLSLRMGPSTHELHVISPIFEPNEDTCVFHFSIYQESMQHANIRIVTINKNNTQVMVDQIKGDDNRAWMNHQKTIGKVSQQFRLMLEVVPHTIYAKGSMVAIDNIQLVKCYQEPERIGVCHNNEYRCNQTEKCIKKSSVCDIMQDCGSENDDEKQNCDKTPFGARCDFDSDWCGWSSDDDNKTLKWNWHNGTTNSKANHSYFQDDHTHLNSIGKYMHVICTKSQFATIATLRSVVFNPPPTVHGNISSPYHNSCQVRFYFHQSGEMKSALALQVTEMRSKENVTTGLSWSYSTYKEPWIRCVVNLPNITYKYFLHFEVKHGIRYTTDIAIDDVSLSPECFGLNIPEADLRGYNYWNPLYQHASLADPHEDFVNETYYEFTSCGVKGRYGPYQANCTESYAASKQLVEVLKEPGLSGIQKWTVPSSGYYTFIALGAGGGKGSVGVGSSRGAMTRSVIEMKKGEEIYVLVGQEGTSACLKSLDSNANSTCSKPNNQNNENIDPERSDIRDILKINIIDGGGGGGGGSFVFKRTRRGVFYPLMAAGGAGGLGLGSFVDTELQHGQAERSSKSKRSYYQPAKEESGYGGAGGGWNDSDYGGRMEQRNGQGFSGGFVGGQACYRSDDGRGDGGFGGGGGGCRTGGGGGGYIGGKIGSTNTSTNDGRGGMSYINRTRTLHNFSESVSGYHAGSGLVAIIPAISGCGCDFRCLALDAYRSQVACICPENWTLDANGRNCIVLQPPESIYPMLFYFILFACLILTVALGTFCFMLYNRYQLKAALGLRRKMLTGADLQLNRLRVASDSMMTEYNPNYEFGGVIYTLKDLKDIPRDQLRLVKALGQGAFGEVYQGFYRQRSGDTVEMPVAVKTLPEMSTNQAEMDFLMEALIMSKFNHPNIVHFIGVCFDKHPRFIVLELLAGGDLKNFLRESRPRPERGSTLTMRDLILISVDVAKGCKYLEDNRFIHRDIAARNCLLTTKGPGRCVKIADFGMSRDIYRSDYYKKGGKAMLPIKWMPPEAFLDGIFTSKTDVWSFGVLLWEIMSMGYMPYTGCANREVMQLVTSGGRLEPPVNCPGPIYGIMTQCWHPTPEERPTFALIMERLGYCTQDPQVMSAPLPVFNRPPSHERDATVMRPNSAEDNCLQVPSSTDYLIPNHTVPVNPSNLVGSTSSVDKLLPEAVDSWETSFMVPNSKSTQPLITETDPAPESTGSVDKLLTTDDKPSTYAPTTCASVPIATSTLPGYRLGVIPNHHHHHHMLQPLDASALVSKQLTGGSGSTNKYSPAPDLTATCTGALPTVAATTAASTANNVATPAPTSNGVLPQQQQKPPSFLNAGNVIATPVVTPVVVPTVNQYLNESEISC